MVAKILYRELNRMINAEFNRMVQEESDKQVTEKLERLKKTEWPKQFSLTMYPKIREKIDNNVLNFLKGPWTTTCNRCQTKQTPEL